MKHRKIDIMLFDIIAGFGLVFLYGWIIEREPDDHWYDHLLKPEDR